MEPVDAAHTTPFVEDAVALTHGATTGKMQRGPQRLLPYIDGGGRAIQKFSNEIDPPLECCPVRDRLEIAVANPRRVERIPGCERDVTATVRSHESDSHHRIARGKTRDEPVERCCVRTDFEIVDVQHSLDGRGADTGRIEDRRSIVDTDFRMVTESAADMRVIQNDGDAMASKLFRRTEAGEHHQLWRPHSAGTQNHPVRATAREHRPE